MCVSYKIPLGYPGHVSAQVSQMTEACYTDIPVLLGETLLWGRGCTVLVQLQDHSAVKRGSDRNQLLQTFFILPPQILIPSLCPICIVGYSSFAHRGFRNLETSRIHLQGCELDCCACALRAAPTLFSSVSLRQSRLKSRFTN